MLVPNNDIFYFKWSNKKKNDIKFKGVNVDYNPKDYNSVNEDLDVLKSNYSNIIRQEEDRNNIKVKKLIFVNYRKLKNSISQFHLTFETNEKDHILSIVVYISGKNVKNTESWVDG